MSSVSAVVLVVVAVLVVAAHSVFASDLLDAPNSEPKPLPTSFSLKITYVQEDAAQLVLRFRRPSPLLVHLLLCQRHLHMYTMPKVGFAVATVRRPRITLAMASAAMHTVAILTMK